MPSIPEEIYQQLINLNCEEVAARLGLDVKNHKCSCFMHEDRHPSLSFFKKDRVAWNCFVCGTGGSAVNLVMQYFGLNAYEAGVWLGNEFGLWSADSSLKSRNIRPKVYVNPSREEEVSADKNFDEEIAQFVLDNTSLTPEAILFLIEERKLSREVIDRLGISAIANSAQLTKKLLAKFNHKRLLESGLVTETKYGFYLKLWSPCLLFPYKDINGNLIGIQSRYLGLNVKAPRFQFLSNSKSHLFNLPQIRNLKALNTVFLAEGITDCLALLSAGKDAIAIPSASIIPKEDIPFLRGLNVVMAADNDDAGQRAIDNVEKSLKDYIKDFRILKFPNDCKDFSEFYLKQVQGSDVANYSFRSKFTESKFIKSLLSFINKKINQKANNPWDDELEISAHLKSFNYMIEVIKYEIMKEESIKSAGVLLNESAEHLANERQNNDNLVKGFCLWLSLQDKGHYHKSYYLPKYDKFTVQISNIKENISLITNIINNINLETWKNLSEKNAKLLFNNFYLVSRSINGLLKVECDAYNIDGLLKSVGKQVFISIWKQNHKSVIFKLSANELNDQNASKNINLKITSILGILDYGKVKYDEE